MKGFRGKGVGGKSRPVPSQAPPLKKTKGSGGAAIPIFNHVPGVVGEVRFEFPHFAELAVESMNGVPLNGSPLSLRLDEQSKDGTRILVEGIPDGVEWQELKDHFAQVGNLAFVNIRGATSPRSGHLNGEVRYDEVEHAEQALQTLNGSALGTGIITVMPAPGSVDGSKLFVQGLPPGIQWQELKDHFSQIGQVAFAAVHQPPKGLTAHPYNFGPGPVRGPVRTKIEGKGHGPGAYVQIPRPVQPARLSMKGIKGPYGKQHIKGLSLLGFCC